MAILNTKLFPPRPSSPPIERTVLQAQLNSGLTHTLTLICAPAGYGKSSLLAAWAKACNTPYCWLQLEAADSDPQRLIHYLCAAIRKAQPNALETTWGFLQGTAAVDTDALSLSFVNEACEIEQDIAVIIDDYHSLNSVACDKLIAQLIEYSPSQLHWFIATREDPSLPLAKWRAKGKLAELRAADLSFAPPEAKAFFDTNIQVQLSNSAIEAICQRTEGWVAALQLAALSFKNQTDVAQKVQEFTGSNRFVTDYLLAEVMTTLSSELKSFIASTVHLPRFNASLCESVTGSSNSNQHLQTLEQNNLFLVALDDQRDWYRFHHLFADVVAGQYSHLGFGKTHVLTKAARWFERNGKCIEAIECARDSGDEPLLAELIELHWPTLRSHHNEADFIRWMSHLSHPIIEQHPVLSAYYGLALLSEQFELGQHFLAKANPPPADATVHNPTAANSVPGMVHIGLAYISGAMGEQAATLANVQSALAQLPPNDHLWRGAASVLLGSQYWWSGDLPQAVTTLRKACKQMDATDDISAQISTRFLLASVLLIQGRLREATRELDTALNSVAELNGIYPQGSADLMVLRAECFFEANDLDQAQALLERVENLGPAAQLAESQHHLPKMRAELAIARNDYRNALAELDTAQALQSHSPTPELFSIDAHRALAAIRCHHLADAQDWVIKTQKEHQGDITLLNAQDLWVVCLFYLNQLTLGAGPIQANQQQAQLLLDLLWPWAEAVDCISFTIDILMAKAELALALAQKRKALEMFEQALSLANSQGFVHKLLQGRVCLKLLPELNKAHFPEIYPHLIQATERKGALTNPVQMTEPLSDRERQVLACLDTSLTGPEIADKLFVSLNTFRTHSKNIYAKLGVNTRRSAVSAARSLQLIDS